jgi:hypothetical protein
VECWWLWVKGEFRWSVRWSGDGGRAVLVVVVVVGLKGG